MTGAKQCLTQFGSSNEPSDDIFKFSLSPDAYLAQARSTEVAARCYWMKAQLVLDRSLGSLLDKNNIQPDDAIEEHIKSQ